MSIVVGTLSNQLWQGLSTDTKPPATDSRVQYAAVFFETDTFKYAIWDGNKWNYTTSAAGTGGTPPML